MTSLPVSVCLITWNRRETVCANLRRILALAPTPAEVIVVENGSTDGTADRLRAEFPGVTLIERSTNAGIAAYNDAFARASQPYILILDDDSLPAPGSVESAVAILARDPGVSAIAFRIVDEATREPAPYWFMPTSIVPQEVTAFVGCGALVRTEALQRIGGYPPEFFLYENELEVGMQLRALGGRIEFHPGCVAYHPSGGKRGTAAMIYHGSKNKLLLAWKYLPAPSACALTIEFLIVNIYLSFRFGRVALRWKAIRDAWRAWPSYRRRRSAGPITEASRRRLEPALAEMKLATWLRR